MKNVIIIGAGISGLTCGIYAQINGFATEIYEQHTIPGGECTGWDRGGYHFDGCIHWLVGTKAGSQLNGMWRDTHALTDEVRVIPCEAYAQYEENGKTVVLYTDMKKLEKHLAELAPEDKPAIRKLCADIHAMRDMEMPIDKPMDYMTAKDGLKMMFTGFSAMQRTMQYSALTMGDIASRFKSPLIRRALLSTFPAEIGALALMSTLAGMGAGDCGFPDGGSRALAKRMEQRYLSLGGKVHYRSKVKEVLVESGKAAGVLLADDTTQHADYVISCADAYATFYKMLGDRYTPEPYKYLFAHPKEYPGITGAIVFMGVDAKIPHPCSTIQVKRDTPATVCGMECEFTQFLHYGGYGYTAPEGKTVISSFYFCGYDYWQALYADRDAYRRAKQELEEDALQQLYARFPEARGKVEITDVVTPMTYVRYCDAWRGNWMSWTKRVKPVPNYFPGLLPGLENFMMAGLWTLPPGGLPGSGTAGRFEAHRLCLMNGIEFRTE